MTSDDVSIYILSMITIYTSFHYALIPSLLFAPEVEAVAEKAAKTVKSHPSPGKGLVSSQIALH